MYFAVLHKKRLIEMKIDYNRLEFIEKEWKKRYLDFNKIFDFKKNIGKRHLDFGCGFGAFLKIVADKYPEREFYGVDMDKNEILLGKKIYNNKNLHLSGLKNIYGKEKFDSVSFFFVLHEVEDYGKTNIFPSSPKPRQTTHISREYKTDGFGDIINVLRQVREMLNENAKIMVYDFRRVSKEKFRKKYEEDKNPKKNSFEDEYAEHNRWITDEFEELMQRIRLKTINISPEGDFYLSYLGEKKW